MVGAQWYWTKWYGQNGTDTMVQFHILCTF